jgi:hypothetical protein
LLQRHVCRQQANATWQVLHAPWAVLALAADSMATAAAAAATAAAFQGQGARLSVQPSLCNAARQQHVHPAQVAVGRVGWPRGAAATAAAISKEFHTAPLMLAEAIATAGIHLVHLSLRTVSWQIMQLLGDAGNDGRLQLLLLFLFIVDVKEVLLQQLPSSLLPCGGQLHVADGQLDTRGDVAQGSVMHMSGSQVCHARHAAPWSSQPCQARHDTS